MSERVPIGLCLGMFLNPTRDCKTKKQKSHGSEYRDKVRCKKLEELLEVKIVTLNKDCPKQDFNHIDVSFNSTSKYILESIEKSFPDGSFHNILYIFLDYFHSPVYNKNISFNYHNKYI